MEDDVTLDHMLECLIKAWERGPVPTRQGYVQALSQIGQWRVRHQDPGLWTRPPRFVTATLDDGLGHGIELIQSCARQVGMDVEPLGLLVPTAEIHRRIQAKPPRMLGLTVLREDAAQDLVEIGTNRPQKTFLVCGGPVFRTDPGLAEEAHVDAVCRNVKDFLAFVLRNRQALGAD